MKRPLPQEPQPRLDDVIAAVMKVWEETHDPAVLADALFLVSMYHPGVIPPTLNNAIGAELKGRQTDTHRERYRTDMLKWKCWVLVRTFVTAHGLTWEQALARAAETTGYEPGTVGKYYSTVENEMRSRRPSGYRASVVGRDPNFKPTSDLKEEIRRRVRARRRRVP